MPSAKLPIIETPTIQPPSPSPTENAEVSPFANWEIVVDSEISGLSDYPYNRTIEQDIAIIQSTIDTLPQLGNLTIALTSGKGARFDRDSQTISVGRNSFPESMSGATIHDYFHFIDPLFNSGVLRQLIGQEKFNELVALRNQALEDPEFPSNIPSLEKIFSSKKQGLSWDYDKNYTPEQISTLVTLYPDAFWLIQGRAGKEGRHIFKPYIESSLGLIEQFALEPGLASWDSFEGFEQANIEKFYQLRREPAMNRAIEILEANKDLLTWENLLWITDAGYDSERFSGNNAADWWKGLPYLVNGALGQAVMTNDQATISLFPPEARGQIKIDLEALKNDAEAERFADLGKATSIYGQETSISPFIEEIQELASEPKTQ